MKIVSCHFCVLCLHFHWYFSRNVSFTVRFNSSSSYGLFFLSQVVLRICFIAFHVKWQMMLNCKFAYFCIRVRECLLWYESYTLEVRVWAGQNRMQMNASVHPMLVCWFNYNQYIIHMRLHQVENVRVHYVTLCLHSLLLVAYLWFISFISAPPPSSSSSSPPSVAVTAI